MLRYIRKGEQNPMERLDENKLEEYGEMSSKYDLIAILNAIKKIVEVSDNPEKDIIEYINEVLEQLK